MIRSVEELERVAPRRWRAQIGGTVVAVHRHVDAGRTPWAVVVTPFLGNPIIMTALFRGEAECVIRGALAAVGASVDHPNLVKIGRES